MNAGHIKTATSVAATLTFTLLKGYFPSNINENYTITMWAFLQCLHFPMIDLCFLPILSTHLK